MLTFDKSIQISNAFSTLVTFVSNILYSKILKLSVLEFVLKNVAKTDRVAQKMAILLEQPLEREKIEKLCLRNVMYRLSSLKACGMFM